MIENSKSRALWSIIVADNLQHEDNRIFFCSGKRLLQKLAFGLLPSFVQQKLRPTTNTKSQRIHQTSYLDGLRGVASFIVFMGHYTEENLGWFTEPYGLYEDGAPSSPLQLPFIRVIYSARPMVHIFFIISGFVLSYKPLKQIHLQQHSALLVALSSSVFRRAFRLFVPSFITLLIMATTVYFGVSDDRYASAFFAFSSQMAHWWSTCWELVQAVWALNDLSYPQPVYNPALWTIPVEFTQSLLLFIVLLGLSRCIAKARFALLVSIIMCCLWSGQLYTVEFLGGMFVAEITLAQDRSLFTLSSSPTILPKFMVDDPPKGKCNTAIKHSLLQAFWVANLICGLFIASWTNNHVDEVWGLRYLDAHTPEPYEGQRFWFCLGGFQIVAACTQVRFLQRIFIGNVPQYLGSISYALYLTHNLCLTILEPRVAPRLDQYFGKTTLWGRQCFWGMGLVFYLPIVICVADLFWRLVDTPTVRFGRWLEEKCMAAPRKM